MTEQKTICDNCGKNSDGLMMCTNDDEVEYLCPDCIIESGVYCLGCGQFWGGVDSFEFSEIDGYCEHCVDEIKTTVDDDTDDEYFPYGSLDY